MANYIWLSAKLKISQQAGDLIWNLSLTTTLSIAEQMSLKTDSLSEKLPGTNGNALKYRLRGQTGVLVRRLLEP